MNNFKKNKDLNKLRSTNLDWNLIQSEMKNKLGVDIYESWLKKIDFVEEFNNYILLSVPTRFIRDWITSRYLDQILQTVRNYKKEIIRIEFKINEKLKNTNYDQNNFKEIDNKDYFFIDEREFNRLIKERSIRPTAFLPIWKLAGYSLGALSAVYGKNAIMACTEAVEEVIDKHYSEQIEELDKSGQEESLLNSLKEFHADEVEHEMIAKKELDAYFINSAPLLEV